MDWCLLTTLDAASRTELQALAAEAMGWQPLGQGVAQLSTLRLNEVIIASGLSFWHKGRRYYYLTHYDPAYANRSPGKILMLRLIEQTFADKGVFCFGTGTYSYKEDWAQSTGELKAAYIFLNPAARGGLDDVINRDFIARLGRV